MDRCVFLPYARQAIFESLRIIGLKAGDSVLLPGFVCRDVLSPLTQLGVKCQFYPVDRRLRMDMPWEKLPYSKAIFAINYFGFAQDLTDFRHYCRNHGAQLIEDNAHGFLSRDDDQVDLGTRGDVGIFSFRKTIPTPVGAGYLLKVPSRADENTAEPYWVGSTWQLSFRVKQLLRLCVPFVGSRAILSATDILRSFRSVTRGERIPLSDETDERNMPQTSNARPYFSRVLQNFDFERERERRRYLYLQSEKIILQQNLSPVFPSLPAWCSPQTLPFFCKNSQIDAVQKHLRKQGLECFPWPSLPSAIRNECPDFYNEIWGVRFIW